MFELAGELTPAVFPKSARAIAGKAFDAFFTTKHRGTGLGLPIARRVIEAHGGQIDILPAAGGGTVVSITLPAAAAAA